MKDWKPRNKAASVRQRLQNLSRKTGEDVQLLLTRYAIERRQVSHIARLRRARSALLASVVSPSKLVATIYYSLGVDPHLDRPDQFRRRMRICNGEPGKALLV